MTEIEDKPVSKAEALDQVRFALMELRNTIHSLNLEENETTTKIEEKLKKISNLTDAIEEIEHTGSYIQNQDDFKQKFQATKEEFEQLEKKSKSTIEVFL